MAPKGSSALDTQLRDKVSSVFDQAQTSTANHRKNCIILYKCQVDATLTAQRGRKAKITTTNKDLFSDTFLDLVNRVLTIKKGTPNATRVVLFIIAYVKFSLQKDCGSMPGPSALHVDQLPAIDEDSASFCLATRLVHHLMQGFESKDRVVRYRCVNMVSELVLNINELRGKFWEVVSARLALRVQDKEPSIRVQAVLTICTVLAIQDNDEDRKEAVSLLGVIAESLCSDPSADVRRTALLHVPLTNTTLPHILTRSRDVDATVRATLFSSVLFPSTTRKKNRTGRNCDLSDICALSLAQREKLVRDGLGDREAKVCAATAQMLDAWFDAVADEVRASADGQSVEEDAERPENDLVLDSMIAFIQLFDFVSIDGDSIAPEALKSLFRSQAKLSRGISFSEEYWTSLSLETSLLARTFVEYLSAQDESASSLDAIGVPVVVAFSFLVQEACNTMFDAIEDLEAAQVHHDEDEDVDEFAQIEDPSQIEQLEANVVDAAFVVSELLKIAAGLDYSDEIGRREMFSVIHDVLGIDLLPECLIETCMEVFRQVTPSETQFVDIVVGIMGALQNSARESVGVANSKFNMIKQADSQDILNDMRPPDSFEDEKEKLEPEALAKLDAMDLRCLRVCIAMLERIDGVVKEGSVLHGLLSSLIVPSVKREEIMFRERGLISLGLFSLLSEDLARSTFGLFVNQVHCTPEDLKLKVMHVVFDLLMMHPAALLHHSPEKTELIITFLLQTLEYEDLPSIQATVCIGLSKLILNGFLHDDRILSVLVLSYASPATAENQMLRQCLAYFLPAYSYSSVANQKNMQSVFLTVFRVLLGIRDADEEGMVTPLQIASEFLDWLDPDKVADQAILEGPNEVQLELACDIVSALYEKDLIGGRHRVFSQILGKLKFPEDASPNVLNRLKVLLEGISENHPLDVLPAQRALEKFSGRFMKRYGPQLEDVDAAQLQDDPLFATACELAGISLENSDHSEDEDENDDDDGQDPETSRHTRNLSPMKPSVKRKPSPILVSSDDDASSDADDASVVSDVQRNPSRVPVASSSHRQKAEAVRSPLKKRHRLSIVSDSDESS